MTHDPGLDHVRLQALRQPTGRTSDPALRLLSARIAEHIATHDGYVAFSGGKDSLAVLDLVRQVEPDVPVAFFDSGLEFPETYTYIHQIAEQWQLDLHLFPSVPPLLDVLVDSGMWDHAAQPNPDTPDLHQILITEPACAAHQLLGPGELWGVRADESAGRRALYTRNGRRDGIITRNDGTIAYGPIWDWSTREVWTYLARRHLPVNPIYDKLTRLGVPEGQARVSHILDGDHIERGRLTWLRRGWPVLFEQLADALPRIRQMI